MHLPGSRRRFLIETASTLATVGLSGCDRSGFTLHGGFGRQRPLVGGFAGPSFERGHRLRALTSMPVPDETRRTDVAIIGGGIAGLAAARALQRAGIDDYRLFELEDTIGGNSRAGDVAGFRCPWGAHYLPLPGPAGDDIADLLGELRLRRIVDGQPQYDERHLCHSPQERLYRPDLQRWQDGLLPLEGQDRATLGQYHRFAEAVREQAQPGRYAIPTARARWDHALTELDNDSFAHWLDRQQLTAPALRWYLDYCCRDDYGASSQRVSAWAGLHYFASRHGFHAPGDSDGADGEQNLTWPEGNAWLAERLAAPHRERTQTGAAALRIRETRGGVEIDVLDTINGRRCRWQADRVIVATPLFIAARVLAEPPAALQAATAVLQYAPWLVANLHVTAPLASARDQPPLSWDNVIYGSSGLGYVNAMNQSLRSHDGATVLTCYRAFGDDPDAGRKALLSRDWQHWAEALIAELAPAHPDLREKLGEIRIARYGHAMAIPAPGIRSSAALAALAEPQGRIAFAHADLSGYSVFEEAFDRGLRAGTLTAMAMRASQSAAPAPAVGR